MRAVYEISDRHIEPGDANALLYEPVANGYTFHRTKLYEFDCPDGTDEETVAAFVRSTLLDPISQDLHRGEEGPSDGAAFVLEYGMKPGALDLEKEAILAYYRGVPEPGFLLEGLSVVQRIYVFGEPAGTDSASLSERFVRDICNAAIHRWNVIPSHA